MSVEFIRQYYQQTSQHQPAEPPAYREAFSRLLNHYLHNSPLLLTETVSEERLPDHHMPEGVLKDCFSLVYGYWYHLPAGKASEKIPEDSPPWQLHINTLLEDGQQAILFQQDREVMRAAIHEPEALEALLLAFVQYQPPQVQAFLLEFTTFAQSLPAITTMLWQSMAQAAHSNKVFRNSRSRLLEQWRTEVHPQLTEDEIHTMLVHHILVRDIFEAVFTDSSFFKENPTALSVEKAAGTVLNHTIQEKLQNLLQPLLQATVSVSRQLRLPFEKQKFLAGIHTRYMQAYTAEKIQEGSSKDMSETPLPEEAVRFMITATDFLLQQHLGRNLSDKDVEVLDPFAGPDLFLSYLSACLPVQVLAEKSRQLHGSTPDLLSYYVSGLTLAATLQEKTVDTTASPLLCFTDTPENTGALSYAGKQQQLFASHTDNLQAIQRQNSRQFCAIIGKPPAYGQRAYSAIDRRIRETFGKSSYTVRNKKPYGMPMRYYRWAMDRLHTDGIISFFTDRQLLDSQEMSGFRKAVADGFDEAYIIDIPENVETSTLHLPGVQEGAAMIFLVRHPERQKEKSQPAVHTKAALRTSDRHFCRVHYTCLPPASSDGQRLSWLRKKTWQDLSFNIITPDAKYRWTGAADKTDEVTIPLQDSTQASVFSLSTPGLKPLQYAWLYDRDKDTLAGKARYFIQQLAGSFHTGQQQTQLSLEALLTPAQPEAKKQPLAFSSSSITKALYRPFTRLHLYFDEDLAAQAHSWQEISQISDNILICIPGPDSSQEFYSLATDSIADYRLMPAGGQCFPLYCLDQDGNRQYNITAQALKQIRTFYTLQEKQAKNAGLPEALQQNLHRLQQESNTLPILRKYYQQIQQQLLAAAGVYKAATLAPVQEAIRLFQQEVAQRKQEAVERKALYQRLHHYLYTLQEQLSQLSLQHRQAEDITQEAVFHYTYGIFHHKPFRRQMAQAQKQSVVKLPLYADFWQWSDWGKQLLKLHTNYESAAPYPLERREKEEQEQHEGKNSKKKATPKPVLSADPQQHMIQLDEKTSLHGIPGEAWQYRLGKYTALEWVLHQYRETKPKDSTLRERFATYCFAAYKEEAIELLQRICTVSIETVKIVQEMEERHQG